MSEVQRWLIQKTPIGTMMKPNPDGNWIAAEDFDRVTAERDAALADVERLDNALNVTDAAAEKWLSDLTKARELFELILDDPRLVVAMSSDILVPIKSLISVKSEPFESNVSALQQRLTAAEGRAGVLEGLLRSMTESYAVSLDAGYDRITALGGKCDSVPRMLADNPDYAKARAALKPAEASKCCTVSPEEQALLDAGDYTPEELFGVGGKPSCPKCAQ